jgi:hypothetical protein
MVMVVTIMLIPSRVIESPTSAKKKMYESKPKLASSLSGAYPVQPVGKPPKKRVVIRITPAAISSQKVSDSIRGKAIRRAPIISGRK